MLHVVEGAGHRALVRIAASTRAVVSWNTAAPQGEIALTAYGVDGRTSDPLPYVRWSPAERRSLGGAGASAHLAVDVLHGTVPLTAVAIESTAALDAVAVATPPPGGAAPRGAPAAPPLDVPLVSQYDAEVPGERGWCSAAATAMLLGAWGVRADLRAVAAAVEDAAYGGTGNWAFNVAYAGARGLRAAVAYLRGLDHAVALTAAGFPVAISIAWGPGELPGAALERSDGHLVVLRGTDGPWAVVNDPAQPAVATRYPRAALDRCFRGHGGAAYLVAPRVRADDLVALANEHVAGP